MNIEEINNKIITLTAFLEAMNLDNSEPSRYNRSIECNLGILKNQLLVFKDEMSFLQRLLKANVAILRPYVNMVQDDVKSSVETIDSSTHLLPSSRNANSYKDQITHIQTEWAKLKSLLGK